MSNSWKQVNVRIDLERYAKLVALSSGQHSTLTLGNKARVAVDLTPTGLAGFLLCEAIDQLGEVEVDGPQ